MIRTFVFSLVCVLFFSESPLRAQEKFFPKTKDFVAECVSEFDQISDERKKILGDIAKYVQDKKNKNETIKLHFICRHNSRRSLIAQAMGAIAAENYGVQGVETYSGGTHTSEFNSRVIAAFQRIGISTTRLEEAEVTNARHMIRYAPKSKPLVFFSKKYDDKANPKSDFCAVMTCAEAAETCPSVPGALVRISLPYTDPKLADGTPTEDKVYDDKCREIAREMLYVFSLIR